MPLSLYVHIPWCIKKCPYCDFNSHAVKDGVPETNYINALLEDFSTDLERFAVNRPIQTVFIGGGTPSLFSPESLSRLITGLQQLALFSKDVEITLEANPGTFESTKFKEFRAVGINRLSIGIQSFNARLLNELGRVHNGIEAIKAVEIANDAGFTNINLDLMFGLPGASPDESENDVTIAIQLNPAHISFYQLTMEPNTWFYKFPPKLPDDDTIFTTQKNCQQLLAKHGYRQYEVSAYAQPDRQCRHNINYWQFGDYLGIGAGAHGKITQQLPHDIVRTAKIKSPESYISQSDKMSANQAVASDELALEFVMNHLRLKSGFTLEHYQTVTGMAASSLQPALSVCQKRGLIKWVDGQYLCTDQGWDFLDNVLHHFIL